MQANTEDIGRHASNESDGLYMDTFYLPSVQGHTNLIVLTTGVLVVANANPHGVKHMRRYNETHGDWTMHKAPTEYAEGQELRTCFACGETETRSVEKLPQEHTRSFDPIVVLVPVMFGLGIGFGFLLRRKKK